YFQKLPKAEAKGRVRMCNLQSAKDCASVKTSLATVHARAQEMKSFIRRSGTYIGRAWKARAGLGQAYRQ
ncbi:hypothetical protein NEOLEDRAFT_1073553, partial [Neolentinus lepideus HHB14362 ss-1]